MPLLHQHRQAFESQRYLRDILPAMYEDILEYHSLAIRPCMEPSRFTCPESIQSLFTNSLTDWERLFRASWISNQPKFNCIKQNMRRHKLLVENPITIAYFEEIQGHRRTAMNAFEKEKASQDEERRRRVRDWLCAPHCEEEQDKHRRTRSICANPGRWLLDSKTFKDWLNPNFSLCPSLWLKGIPGAGMVTNLAIGSILH